jgi:RNA polymerase primary sigma factor
MTAIKERKAKQTVTANSDENVLAQYLHELSRVPLLTKAAEEAAARAAAGGDKAARDRLVNGNLRFVINIAKQYQGKGLPLEDLISEGNIGLMQAVDHFDVDKGYRFISYAVWWIRQNILKAINEKSRMIRLPQNRAHELVQIEKARRVIQEQMSFHEEIEEIAKFLEMDAGLVEELLSISREMVSLEKTIYVDYNQSVLGDFIEDKRSIEPDQKALQNIMAHDIESILETLDGRERDVIRYRFGLGNKMPMSLEEIGDHFNLTKERIRQIEHNAILRLQRSFRIKKLSPYVA